jgi:alkylhydroperoxidase family enzyme
MARISLIEPEGATPEVKQKLKGRPGNLQKALAHRPDMLKNFLGFYASVGRSLERKVDELIYIRVSMINGCRYCRQPFGFVKARRPDTGGLERAQAGKLFSLQRKGKSGTHLCGEVDSISS